MRLNVLNKRKFTVFASSLKIELMRIVTNVHTYIQTYLVGHCSCSTLAIAYTPALAIITVLYLIC